MPKTVTLSDADLAALQAVRQVVADVNHPARPAAIAALDAISRAPCHPEVTRSGPHSLDPSDPSGYRCLTLDWRADPDLADTAIVIPAGQDLLLEVRRPGSQGAVLSWPMWGGDCSQRRALRELRFMAITRSHGS